MSGPTNDGTPRPRYDPAFRQAVEAGLLTQAQALSRGRREIYADGLVRRYRLTREAAYAVADNRTTLSESRLARQEASAAAPVPLPPRPRRSTSPVRIIVGVGMSVAIAVAGWQWWSSPTDGVPAVRPRVTRSGNLVLNAQGEVLRVIGKTPEAALDSYCRAVPGPAYEPLGLVPASSTTVPVRIGLLDTRGDAPKAVAIRLDRSSRRWYIGDGVRPIVPRNAPPGALQVAVRH